MAFFIVRIFTINKPDVCLCQSSPRCLSDRQKRKFSGAETRLHAKSRQEALLPVCFNFNNLFCLILIQGQLNILECNICVPAGKHSGIYKFRINCRQFTVKPCGYRFIFPVSAGVAIAAFAYLPLHKSSYSSRL